MLLSSFLISMVFATQPTTTTTSMEPTSVTRNIISYGDPRSICDSNTYSCIVEREIVILEEYTCETVRSIEVPVFETETVCENMTSTTMVPYVTEVPVTIVTMETITTSSESHVCFTECTENVETSMYTDVTTETSTSTSTVTSTEIVTDTPTTAPTTMTAPTTTVPTTSTDLPTEIIVDETRGIEIPVDPYPEETRSIQSGAYKTTLSVFFGLLLFVFM